MLCVFIYDVCLCIYIVCVYVYMCYLCVHVYACFMCYIASEDSIECPALVLPYSVVIGSLTELEASKLK